MNALAQKSTASKAIILWLLVITHVIYSQQSEEVQTLIHKNSKVDFLWSPGIKFNSIQGDIGTAIEIYAGPVFNQSLLLGPVGGVNFGHPKVNYGYFGVIAQYMHKPNRLFHWGAQLISAYGTTKDYEQAKSSLFDNFWNITGTSFFVMEPGINIELNLKERIRLMSSLSFRFVFGLDSENQYVSRTRVNNQEMSGVNLRIGIAFTNRKKQ